MEGQETVIGSDIKMCRARKPMKRFLNELELIEIEAWVELEMKKRIKEREKFKVFLGLAFMGAWGFLLLAAMEIPDKQILLKYSVMVLISGVFTWYGITKSDRDDKEIQKEKMELLQRTIQAAQNS